MSSAVLAAGAWACRAVSRRTAPIVLYHAAYGQLPEGRATGVHNVTPATVINQLEWLGRSYRFVDVDSWFAEGCPTGVACVTFDDAYLSACELLPQLIERGIPSTVFVNGATLRGQPLWRELVVDVINRELAPDLLASSAAVSSGVLAGVSADDFYLASKQPDRNSKLVHRALAEFLGDEAPATEHATSADQLPDHELVRYGSHSLSHYYLASLSDEEQGEELRENERLLDALGLRRSRVFSIPFGGRASVNEATGRLLREMGSSGVLFSDHAVNRRPRTTFGEVPSGSRYMAPDSIEEFASRHLRLSITGPDSRSRRVARAARARVRDISRR